MSEEQVTPANPQHVKHLSDVSKVCADFTATFDKATNAARVHGVFGPHISQDDYAGTLAPISPEITATVFEALQAFETLASTEGSHGITYREAIIRHGLTFPQ